MVNEQNEPVQDGALDANLEEKIAGIVEQITADSAGRTHSEIIELVSQRFAEACIPLDEASLEELVSEITAIRG